MEFGVLCLTRVEKLCKKKLKNILVLLVANSMYEMMVELILIIAM